MQQSERRPQTRRRTQHTGQPSRKGSEVKTRGRTWRTTAKQTRMPYWWDRETGTRGAVCVHGLLRAMGTLAKRGLSMCRTQSQQLYSGCIHCRLLLASRGGPQAGSRARGARRQLGLEVRIWGSSWCECVRDLGSRHRSLCRQNSWRGNSAKAGPRGDHRLEGDGRGAGGDHKETVCATITDKKACLPQTALKSTGPEYSQENNANAL